MAVLTPGNYSFGQNYITSIRDNSNFMQSCFWQKFDPPSPPSNRP